MQHQIDVGLLDGHFAAFFRALDERVLDLDLRPELQAIGERVPDHQHEAMQVGFGGKVLLLVEMDLHVAGNRRHAFA